MPYVFTSNDFIIWSMNIGTWPGIGYPAVRLTPFRLPAKAGGASLRAGCHQGYAGHWVHVSAFTFPGYDQSPMHVPLPGSAGMCKGSRAVHSAA